MPIGILVNSCAILIGGLLGAAVGNKIPEHIRASLPLAFGCCSMLMGITNIVKMKTMPVVGESLVLQDGEHLIALVYPDPDDVQQIPLSQEEVAMVMEQNRTQLNAQLPSYCRLKEIRLHDSEFAKTAKKSIKRYLYKA